MATARLSRQVKRPYGICVKITAVAMMGLCFIIVWSFFSSSNSVTVQRESFEDIAEPVSDHSRTAAPVTHKQPPKPKKHPELSHKVKPELQNKDETTGDASAKKHKSNDSRKDKKKIPSESRSRHNGNKEKQANRSSEKSDVEAEESEEKRVNQEVEAEEAEGSEEEEVVVVDGKEQGQDGDGDGDEVVDTEGESDLAEVVDPDSEQKLEDVNVESNRKETKSKSRDPLFDPQVQYNWKLCSTRSKHNYIPCIDFEVNSVKQQSYRHTERSCPKTPVMCLVPLPQEGYGSPVPWPESKVKILHKNVAHPKLSSYIKKHNWLEESGGFLIFPRNESEFSGGVLHYLEFIEEMVPDIEWGKNIRVILDIGSSDSSFGLSLLDKEVLTLTLGLKDDLVDLAQIALERGFPAVVSPFSRRRLPFPSGVFDVIHCGSCSLPWHSNGGRLLQEMNRILRPGGYFILSARHEGIEEEEATRTLTASMCWNILAHKTDEISDIGVKVYQKPESNEIYELRRKKSPPLCKEKDNPDAAWYVPIMVCLNVIPSAIEQRGTEWPEEWPKRLESYPEWLNNKEKIVADTSHWKSIVEKSYLTGLGIDWSTIRNVMDMKAIYGGLAAALSQRNVWVMNVIPVHAPDTLPFIFERGLVGIYHDWCEPFGTYPRTYDLLHADHLFSRVKNRCKQPVSIIVEMDRILRPGGWLIIRDKVAILNPLEGILRSLHWEIRMTFAQEKEGLLCAQRTMWRPSFLSKHHVIVS